MENLIFRTRPDERSECEQWTLIADEADGQDYVVQEHVKLDALRSCTPYLRLVKRMTVAEFLGTDQPAAVKIKLQAILGAQSAAKASARSEQARAAALDRARRRPDKPRQRGVMSWQPGPIS